LIEAPAPAPRSRVRGLLDRDWVFALSLAFAVGVLVWFGHSIKEFFAPNAATISIPAFSGQTQTDAQDECTRVNLRCTILASQPSDRFPKDVIMGQQPAAGTRVRAGRNVSLIVSTGVVIFPMPDLRDESQRNAALDLNRRKLQLTKTMMVANSDIPQNYVVAQDPPPLSSVREGAGVTLSLSKGPPSDVKVPNFTGESIDAARDEAGRSNIHIGQVVWTPFGSGGPARGTVMRQSPGPGAQIDPFEEVSLQVSAGPHEFGYLVRQVHVAATVPARDDAAHVRMEVRDDTGTWNVYDGYAQGGQKLDFNVTAIGTAELDTYINNELLNQSPIGKEVTPKPSASPHASGK